MKWFDKTEDKTVVSISVKRLRVQGGQKRNRGGAFNVTAMLLVVYNPRHLPESSAFV